MLESLSSRKLSAISLLKTIFYLNIERINDVSIRILPKQLFKRFSRTSLLEEGRAFVAQIPIYFRKRRGSFDVGVFLIQKFFTDYMEIVFNGNIVPLSRFSFNSEENVDII